MALLVLVTDDTDFVLSEFEVGEDTTEPEGPFLARRDFFPIPRSTSSDRASRGTSLTSATSIFFTGPTSEFRLDLGLEISEWLERSRFGSERSEQSRFLPESKETPGSSTSESECGAFSGSSGGFLVVFVGDPTRFCGWKEKTFQFQRASLPRETLKYYL